MGLPIIGDIINAVKDLVGEVVVDKDKRDQVNLELEKLRDQSQARLDEMIQGQLEVNKVEAASGSLFVAGWRPFAGWVGGVGLAYSAIIEPFMSWIARLNGYVGNFPSINNELILYTLGGMLGLGTMRTFEKWNGTATNDYTAGQPKPNTTTTETKTSTTTVGPITKKKGWKPF